METATKNLSQLWSDLIKEQPRLRIRNAAEALGVSELELLNTKVGHGAIRLRPEFQNILGEVESLGKVMALTRNNEVVHERKGIYLNPELNNPHVGLFVGEDIDLRIFFASWKHAFAVTENNRKSLQFFNSAGEALHKIYLTEESNINAFDNLVDSYADLEQEQDIQIVKPSFAPSETSDSEIKVTEFQEAWRGLKDTHAFFGLLKKFGVSRTQALRLAPKDEDYAIRVENIACRTTLELASKNDQEIMVFVGNPGMIQIHTGPVKKVVEAGGWYNVLDPDFNLHIKDSEITQTWIVRKPTEDGMVTALECFNSKGEQIVQLFGKRKPGIPEQEGWRQIINEVQASMSI